MKKQFILSGLAITAALSASAQIADMPSFESERPCTLEVTPSYLAGGIPFITFQENGDFIVYDEAFNLERRFAWQSERIKRTTTRYNAVPTFDIASTHMEGPLADGTKFTQATALELISNWGMQVAKVEEGSDETRFITGYYCDWQYGENIVERYFSLKSSGELYNCVIEYGEQTGYSDIWVKADNENDETDTSTPVYIHYFNTERGVDDYYVTLTKSLFNDDDSYEYLMPVYTKTKKEYFYYDSQFENQPSLKHVVEGDILTACKLINNEGRVLQTIDLSFYEYTDLPFIYIYVIGEYTYIEFYNKLFRIDKASSSLAEVNMPSGIKVSPRVTPRSTPVNVTLGESGTERTVTVAGSNGMTYTTIRVAPGANSATIDTSRMPAGMYVVTVSENGRNTENCKIVVR